MEQNDEMKYRKVRKWKWVIILSVSMGTLFAGAYLFPGLSDASAFSVLAVVLGLFWAGYACSRLDQDIGEICIHVQVRRWKPHITITKGK